MMAKNMKMIMWKPDKNHGFYVIPNNIFRT